MASAKIKKFHESRSVYSVYIPHKPLAIYIARETSKPFGSLQLVLHLVHVEVLRMKHMPTQSISFKKRQMTGRRATEPSINTGLSSTVRISHWFDQTVETAEQTERSMKIIMKND